MNQKGFVSAILVVIVFILVLGIFLWPKEYRPTYSYLNESGNKATRQYTCFGFTYTSGGGELPGDPGLTRHCLGFPYQKSTSPQNIQTTQTPTAVSKTFFESEIIASLKTNWQTVQVSIPFRPIYHNQAENAAKIWRTPTAVQFIGKNNILVRFEDDNNVHVAVFNFNGSKFNFSEVFKNQGEFTLSDWQNLVNKYGDSTYPVGTYTTGLIRNKQIVNFPDLTKVSENIFVKNYWEN